MLCSNLVLLERFYSATSGTGLLYIRKRATSSSVMVVTVKCHPDKNKFKIYLFFMKKKELTNQSVT